MNLKKPKNENQKRNRLLTREQAAHEQEIELNRFKDEFLATLSHELLSPLNSILGWLTALRSGRLTPVDATRALETIEKSARLQHQLIKDLLDIAGIVTGKHQSAGIHEIELKPVIRAAIESLTPVAEARGIHIECSFDPADIFVAGDAERLQQIAWNLISNAVKFTPAGGRVLVQLEKVRAQVELTVSDTGIGILPEFLPHMFERFRQSDCSTTRKYGGLGLGLSLVRHLVELHGGTVHASSDGEGCGAIVVVTLPVLVKTQPQRRINTGNNPVRLISPVLECIGVPPPDWFRYLMSGDHYFHLPWLPEQPK